MAANKRDVELVVRARNEATKALDAVSGAFQEILKSSQEFQKGSRNTDSILQSIGQELGKLRQSSDPFERLAQGSQRAEKAVERLQGNIKELSEDNVRLTKEAKAAAAAQDKLAAEADQASVKLEKQQQATKETKDQHRQLTKELKSAEVEQRRRIAADERAATTLTKLGDRALKAQERYDRLGAEIAQSDAPTKRLQQSYEAAGRALEKQLRTLLKAQQAQAQNRQELAATGRRVSDLSTNLGKATRAYEENSDALARQKNLTTEARDQARAAQQTYQALEKSLEANTRDFNKQGAALQEANVELQQVRETTAQADAAIGKLGGTIRLQLLRSLSDAQAQLRNFQNAQQFGTATLAGLAAQPGGRESAEFQQMAQQARIAKEAVREQQIAIEQMRRELREAGTDVNKLAAAEQKFQQAMAQANARSRQAAAALRQQADATDRTRRETDQAANSNQRFAATLALLRRNSRQSLSFMQRMRGELLALTTTYFGLQAAISGTQGVAKAYMTLEAVQNRLGAVFEQNTQRVSQEIDWLMSQADRLGIAFDVLSDSYAKFSVAASVANFESQATREIFLSVAEAGRVNKLSVEQMNGIFLALEQIISKGKVTSEELRRQLGDRLPGAFQTMAEALGMTTMELDAALTAGEVYATQDTLLKFADQLDERFGDQLPESLKSFTAELGRFQNELFKAELRAGQSGFIEGMRASLASMTEFFQSAEGQEFFNNLGAAAGAFLQVLALIPQNFDTLLTLAAAFVGFKLGAYIRALATDFAALSVKTRASAAAQAANNAAQVAGAANTRGLTSVLAVLRATFVSTAASARASAAGIAATARGLTAARVAAVAVTGSMRVLRLVLATVGGPIGLIATGLSILFANWITSADDATVATSELARQLQQLRKAYAEVGEAADASALNLDKLTVTQAEANLESLRDQVAEKVGEIEDLVSGEALSFGNLFESASDLRERLRPVASAFEEVQKAMAAGLVPDLQKFRKALDEAAQADPRIKELATDILNIVDAADDNGQSLDDLTDAYSKQQKVLVALTGSTEDQKAALQDLGILAEESATKQATAAQKLDEAYAKLNKELPEARAELERLEKIDKLTDILREFEEANTQAWEGSDIERYLDLVGKVQAGIRAINQEAAQKAVSGGLVDRIIGVESGGNASARNPNSSATGLGQFIESTWLRMFKQYFPDRAKSLSDSAILALRTDAEISRNLIEKYALENAKTLQAAGESVNDASLYLAHFLGPQGALRVLQAEGSTPVADLLSQGAISANQSVLGGGQTAAGLLQWAQQKVGTTEQELAVSQRLHQLEQERLKTQQEFNESLSSASSDREFQVKQLQLEEQGMGRQAAINEAIREAETRAAEDNLALTKQQRQEIERTTGALYDQQNAARIAAEERQRIEQRVNDLVSHRRDLMEAIEFAQGQGDQPAADQLKIQMEDITRQLYEAINAARMFWRTQTGPEAQAALTALQNVENSIQSVGHTFLLTAEQIDQNAATMGAEAFEGFVDSLMEGENAMDSLQNALRSFAADFLRMIARMIVQQAIFNALQSAGFGGGVGGIVGGLFHTGGIVGTSGVSRVVSPAWFSGAARYHTGGIAGLKPNEVPAILERGEEVLTKNDPRHAANGGGAGGAAPEFKILNMIDSGSFVSEGMNTVPGQQAIMNFMRANRGKIKGILG